MPSPVILARTNVAFTRPDWNNLQIDPQAPEAQGLYVAGAVPPGRTPAQLTSAVAFPKYDKSSYNWPVTHNSPLGSAGDSTVGSFVRASGTATKYTVALNPPPPSTNNSTLAIWVRRRGALTAGQFIASLAATVGIQIGTDASTPLLYTWGNGAVTTATGLIQPLDEWALVVGTHTGANSFTYLFAPGVAIQSASYADSNVVRVVSSVAAGGTGATSQSADYADLAFWARAFTPQEVLALWDPATRWRRYYVPKTYWQFGDTPVADTQPLAAQPPRPKYIGLNAFSPQAQGLRDWLVSVDGALVQAWTSNKGMTTGLGVSTDQPSTVVQRQSFLNAFGSTQANAPASQNSDLGVVARSAKVAESDTNRGAQFWRPNLNLATMTDLTMVYWIYPLPSPYRDAFYWGTQPTADQTVMRNDLLTFETTQSFTLPSDPHIPGRWQMMTVARTLAGVNIWRDQTLVFTGTSTGTAIDVLGGPWFQVGGANFTDGTTNAVNALWADFRIYDREWKQADVEYAFNPQTRWDYYKKPSFQIYQAPLTVLNIIQLAVSGSITPSAAITMLVGKGLSASWTPSGALAKAISRVVAGAFTPTATTAKTAGKVLAGAFTPSAAIVRGAGKGLVASFTPAATLGKAGTKTAAGTVAPSSALANAAAKAAAGSVAPFGGPVKAAAKSLGGGFTPSGALDAVRAFLLAMGGTIAPAAGLAKSIGKGLAGVFSSSGTLPVDAGKSLAGAVAPVGTLPKDTSKAVDGAIAPTGDLSVLRMFFLAISATLTLAGDLISGIIAGHPRLIEAFGMYAASLNALGRHQSKLDGFGRFDPTQAAVGKYDPTIDGVARHEDVVDTFGNEGEE